MGVTCGMEDLVEIQLVDLREEMDRWWMLKVKCLCCRSEEERLMDNKRVRY